MIDPRVSFVALLVVMVGLAVGHLFPLYGSTGVQLGVPSWIWIQLIVIAILLGLAWIATTIIEPQRRV